MNKKIIMPIALVLMVSVTGFVCASNIRSLVEIQGGINESIIENINDGWNYASVNEGWNLIRGFINPKRIMHSESDILQNNIKAIYLLKQPSKEYVRIYPDPEYDKLENIGDTNYEQTAQWVFSDKSGKLIYMSESPLPLKTNQLYKGWNLVGITYAMYDKYPDGTFALNSIKGSCDIEDVYLYSSVEWGNNLVSNLDKVFDNSILMKGFAIKVSDDCRMGIDINRVTEDVSCIDTENGAGNYETGEITHIVFGTFGIDESTYTDVCLYGKLNEYYCDGNEMKQTSISCEEGFVCRDGKCVQGDESLPFCLDSDGGKDYYVKGRISGDFHDKDNCYNYDSNSEVYACSGKDCAIIEYSCCSPGEIIEGHKECEFTLKDTHISDYFKCPNGCQDGACI